MLAESAYKETYSYKPRRRVNLSLFEKLIGGISDCVIIFPESVGSYAEAGLFSYIDEISEKTLVVNDLTHFSKNSFLNRGTINLINNKSYLMDAIPLDTSGRDVDFAPIKERLEYMFGRGREPFDHKEPQKLNNGHWYILILEMINVFRLVKFTELLRVMDSVLGSTPRQKDARDLLSILCSVRHVVKHDDFYAPATPEVSFLEYSEFDKGKLIISVLHYYQRHENQRFNEIKRLNK